MSRIKKQDEKSKWSEDQLANLQGPIMAAVKEALKGAYTKPEVIIEALNNNIPKLTEDLQSMISSVVLLERPSPFDKIGNGYMIVADDIMPARRIKMSQLELVPVLRDGEESITGEILLERSRKMPGFGQHHGQFFIDNWWDLPMEFREKNDIHIALPGTIFQRKGEDGNNPQKGDGFLFMSSFYHSGNRIFSDSEYIGEHLGQKFGSKWYFLRMKKR